MELVEYLVGVRIPEDPRLSAGGPESFSNSAPAALGITPFNY